MSSSAADSFTITITPVPPVSTPSRPLDSVIDPCCSPQSIASPPNVQSSPGTTINIDDDDDDIPLVKRYHGKQPVNKTNPKTPHKNDHKNPIPTSPHQNSIEEPDPLVYDPINNPLPPYFILRSIDLNHAARSGLIDGDLPIMTPSQVIQTANQSFSQPIPVDSFLPLSKHYLLPTLYDTTTTMLDLNVEPQDSRIRKQIEKLQSMGVEMQLDEFIEHKTKNQVQTRKALQSPNGKKISNEIPGEKENDEIAAELWLLRKELTLQVERNNAVKSELLSCCNRINAFRPLSEFEDRDEYERVTFQQYDERYPSAHHIKLSNYDNEIHVNWDKMAKKVEDAAAAADEDDLPSTAARRSRRGYTASNSIVSRSALMPNGNLDIMSVDVGIPVSSYVRVCLRALVVEVCRADKNGRPVDPTNCIQNDQTLSQRHLPSRVPVSRNQSNHHSTSIEVEDEIIDVDMLDENGERIKSLDEELKDLSSDDEESADDEFTLHLKQINRMSVKLKKIVNPETNQTTYECKPYLFIMHCRLPSTCIC